ncbi:hypothetical protein GSI_07969 [Ganoderma sinense ZZ0214-1]|uniref:Uncharacterized protein n=1 Tax=Ganoderma sinense ZZ0214-1 TaxID=1077348 RepID=A0A2G8S7Q2_9APHY|nr:hypothetical protein GSI_07969 [Ganoderma sinense ZZ0214-1]
MGISLWLVPNEEDAERIKLVMQYKPTSPTKSPSSFPTFHPHVTLATTSDPAILRAALPPNLPVIPVQFKSAEVGEKYFMSVYVAVHSPNGSPLENLRSHLRAVLGDAAVVPSVPHISLYYIDDADKDTRMSTLQDLHAHFRVIGKPGGERSVTADLDGMVGLGCYAGSEPSKAADSSYILRQIESKEIWLVRRLCERRPGGGLDDSNRFGALGRTTRKQIHACPRGESPAALIPAKAHSNPTRTPPSFPSRSSLSHAAAAQNDGGQSPVGSDPNHSPTMIPGMSQPPNHAGPVQGAPYAAVHRQHPGAYGLQPAPNAYQQHPQHPQSHHVVQYVTAHPGHAPQGHTSELMYSVEATQQSQNQGQGQQGQGPNQSQSQVQAEPQEEEEDEPPPPPTASTNGKRKQPDSATPDTGAKKRRQRIGASGASASAVGAEDGDDGQDMEVGPNGGAKHWTEEEKTRFFTWMLTSDEHWEAFKTRMNTVFRECSAELFPGRKSYTALKSCYHRNLEVFKQIHAFQVFSANHHRQLQAENPHAEQPSVDSMLDVARVAGLNVGSLNVKVIDRWYETGWYNLFKKRYREDPKTGLLAPYYGPPDQPEPGPSSGPPPMMGLHTTIDPQLMAGHPAQAGQETQYGPPPGEGSQSVGAMVSGAPYPYASPGRPTYYRESGPSTANQPPAASQSFQYLRSQSAVPPKVLPGASAQPLRPPIANGQRHSPYPEPPPVGGEQYVPDYHPHTTHAIAQLTTVADSLLGVCSSIKELLQQQIEESKARTELMRAEAGTKSHSGNGQPKEREKEISMEKVTFATEILKNGPQNEEIKKAAIECLTKYLMRDL